MLLRFLLSYWCSFRWSYWVICFSILIFLLVLFLRFWYRLKLNKLFLWFLWWSLSNMLKFFLVDSKFLIYFVDHLVSQTNVLNFWAISNWLLSSYSTILFTFSFFHLISVLNLYTLSSSFHLFIRILKFLSYFLILFLRSIIVSWFTFSQFWLTWCLWKILFNLVLRLAV